MLNKKKNNKGFTLVELLVVIAIIGILAVVAVPALFKNIEKAKVADLQADVSAIKSATMSYVADNNAFPNGTGTAGLTGVEAILDAYDGEIENLSNPFDATYNLKLEATGTTPAETGRLLLTVTLAEGKNFSKKSIEKLYNDLGNSLVQFGTTTIVSGTKPTLTGANSVVISVIEAPGVTATPTPTPAS